VRTLWASDDRPVAAGRERVLPTGDMHLVFRLGDEPLRLFDDIADRAGRTVGCAVVGGARASCYVREVASPTWSVGAQLCAGASQLFFGIPADRLADRHTSLDDLWPRSAARIREQLQEARRPERQLALLEALLETRLPTARGLHPAVAQDLARFRTAPDVGAAIAATGYSHRGFTALFRRDVGLTPKRYCRVLRFQRVLDRVAADPTASWVRLALDAGYSDQPHFNREFREFAGITPGAYRRLSPRFAHHVAIPEVDFVQDRGRDPRYVGAMEGAPR
jgi:AraC-like DNA-binding protein